MATQIPDPQKTLSITNPLGAEDTKITGFPFNIVFVGWATRIDGVLDETTASKLGLTKLCKVGDTGPAVRALQLALIKALKALGVACPLKSATGVWEKGAKNPTTKALQTYQIKNAADFQISSEVTENITSVQMSWNLDGAAQMTISLIDPDMKMLNNNYFLLEGPNNYLGLRRLVLHYNQKLDQWYRYEIASVEYSPGESSSPKVTLECRSEAIQRMKRDKNPARFSGTNGTAWARQVAIAFELDFIGQETTKTRQIKSAANEFGERESTWDVMKQLASDAQFVVFEADGYLFFGSEQWLLGKWGIDKNKDDVRIDGVVDANTLKALGVLGTGIGKIPQAANPANQKPKFGEVSNYVLYLTQALRKKNIPLTGGPTRTFNSNVKKALMAYQKKIAAKTFIPITWPIADERFQVTEMPTVRRSDDSVWQATGSAKLIRNNGLKSVGFNGQDVFTNSFKVDDQNNGSNAEQLRAGMTIQLSDINGFNAMYLIDSVDFEEGVPDPVAFTFRTPERLKRKKGTLDENGKFVSEPAAPVGASIDVNLPPGTRVPAVRVGGG
jgi:hypothetical protein